MPNELVAKNALDEEAARGDLRAPRLPLWIDVVWDTKAGPVHVPMNQFERSPGRLTWCGRKWEGWKGAEWHASELAGRTLCMNCGRSILARPRNQLGSLDWAWDIAYQQRQKGRPGACPR